MFKDESNFFRNVYNHMKKTINIGLNKENISKIDKIEQSSIIEKEKDIPKPSSPKDNSFLLIFPG